MQRDLASHGGPFVGLRRTLKARFSAAVSLVCGLACALFALAAGAQETPQSLRTQESQPTAQRLRVVAVGSDVTEIVYRLGLGDQLVATDTSSIYPPQTQALPKVGYHRNLAAEGVLSVAPDLIVASATAGPDTALQQLQDAGVPVVKVPQGYTIAAIGEKIGRLAAALDAEAAGAAMLAEVEADWAAAQAQIAASDARGLRGLFFLALGEGGPQAAGRNTAADAAMALLGVENVFTAHEGFKAMSLEAALAADPEVILVMRHNLPSLGGLEGVAEHPALRLTSAARARRIVAVEADAALAFGPRTPAALGALAQAIAAGAIAAEAGE